MLRLVNFVTFLLTVLISASQAQADGSRKRDHIPEWVLLGQRWVDFTEEVDAIDIERSNEWHSNRKFKYLHFFLDENSIVLMRIKITYVNGYVDEGIIGKPNEGELVTDHFRWPFPNESSYIKQIAMTYKSDPKGKTKRAIVRVIGEMATDRDYDDWVQLGCEYVSIFGRDHEHEKISVGLQDGRFKAIRLHAYDGDVRLKDLRLIYINGTPQEIAIPNYLPVGKPTEVLLLKHQRAIERVELVYRSAVTAVDIVLREKKIRRPKLCVEGLQTIPF